MAPFSARFFGIILNAVLQPPPQYTDRLIPAPSGFADYPFDPLWYGERGVPKVTTAGDLVWIDPNEQSLYAWPLSGQRAVRKVTPHLPNGTLDLGTDYTVEAARQFVLCPDGHAVLVCVEVPDGRFTAWIHRLLRRSQTRWEFQRVPLDGGEPQPVFSVDQRVSMFYLSADGKSLVYRLLRAGSGRERFWGPGYWVRLP